MDTNTGNNEAGNCRFLDKLFERINCEMEKINGNEKAKRGLIYEMRSYVEGLLKVLIEHNENTLYDLYSKKFRDIGFRSISLPAEEDKMN